ncbi:MAG: hypothetical protein NVS9B13_26540 [Candidatus Acidiferrum sp.]
MRKTGATQEGREAEEVKKIPLADRGKEEVKERREAGAPGGKG